MIDSITISVAPMRTWTLAPREVQPRPSGYAQVLHCSQSPVTDYRRYMTWRGFVETTGRGDPSVFQLVQTPNQRAVYLTRSLQEWMFGLLRESSQNTMTDAELLAAWKNLTAWNKAFNNKGGREQGYADYILHENEDAPLGLAWQPVIATGATVKLVGAPYKKYNTWLQNFEILNARNPATLQATYKKNWMHIFPATNSLNLDHKKERIDPFPKMRGDRDTPVPLLGNDTTVGIIQRDWLRPMMSDEPHPAYPYLPMRETGTWDKNGVRKL